MKRYQLDRIDSRLRSFTAIVPSELTSGLPPELNGTADRAEPLDSALDLVGAPYLVYLGADGEVAEGFLSSRLDRASIPPTDELRAIPANGEAVGLSAADGSERRRAVARTTAESGGTVIAAAPLSEADATIDRLRLSSVISGVVLLVLLTGVGWFALRRGLRPLRRIELTAAAIADGDLTRRVPDLAPTGTEIGHLSASLNTMLGQLEHAFADQAASEARMRTFVSDVSHELRTPLFGIKGSTELYRMGAMPDSADVDEAMHRIDREATRITALTEGLLLLAQLDEDPAGQLDAAPMDLRTLADDARHDLRTLDPARSPSGSGNAGLGLAIARAHGGNVELETAVGEGACFRLTLPLIDQE